MRTFFLALLVIPIAACGGGGGSPAGGGGGSSDATLSALSGSVGELVPAFSAATLTYALDTAALVSSVSLTPTPNDPTAVVRVDGAIVPPGAASAPAALLGGVPRPLDVEVRAADGTTTLHYTVVVTREAATSMVEQAYLKASNTGAGDQFGWQVAVSGDTLVVGARSEAGSGAGVNPPDDDLTGWSGAAYVFVRTAGVWAHQAYLKASVPGELDLFGSSVAVSGDTIVVGAPLESSGGTGVNPPEDPDDVSGFRSGAAYVFVRTAGVWTQQAFLKASNTGVNDGFGSSVAVSGETIVVGAWSEAGSGTGVNPPDDELAPSAGAAYVFVRSAGTWTQQAYLKASNTDPDDSFGSSLALSGNTLVVAAAGEDGSGTGVNPPDDELAEAAGAVYVFVRTAGTWAQQAYLKASNADAGDAFGASVAVSGDTIVVGAIGEAGSGLGVNPPDDELARYAGAAYVFVRSAGMWAQEAHLKPSNQALGYAFMFGASVAVSGDAVVVGAPGESGSGTGINPPSDSLAVASGAAYLFVRNAGTWAHLAYVKASNTREVDSLGRSVAVSGDTAFLAVFAEDGSGTGVNPPHDDLADEAGAVYVLR